MKKLLPLFILASCALSQTSPSWVAGIRSGQEQLKIPQGEKIFYRRISGNSSQGKDEACDQAIQNAAEDIKKGVRQCARYPTTCP